MRISKPRAQKQILWGIHQVSGTKIKLLSLKRLISRAAFILFILCNLLLLSAIASLEQPIPVPIEDKLTATTIESDYLQMERTPKGYAFYFRDNVLVNGDNLSVQCNEMRVHTQKEEQQVDTTFHDAQDPKTAGSILSIVSMGSVLIQQNERSARGEKAEVFFDPLVPNSVDRIVLTGNPSLTSSNGSITGWRITLHQQEGRVIVESNDPKNKMEQHQRPIIKLNTSRNMGINLEAAGDLGTTN